MTSPPTVQILGATRLARVAIPYLCEQGRARIVGVDLRDEDESRPFFAPVRQRARDFGVPIGRFPADLTLDLDPDHNPGEGALVRIRAPAGVASADINRALLGGGAWSMVVCDAEGRAGWGEVAVVYTEDDDAETLLDRATLAGIEALAAAFPQLVAGAAPAPLDRPVFDPTGRLAPRASARWRHQEGLLLWEQPAERIVSRIRACAGPYEGARTHCGETLLHLLDARLVHPVTSPEWTPGTLTAIDRGVEIATGRGIVRVERLRPGWRPARPAGEWAAEVGLSPGYQLG